MKKILITGSTGFIGKNFVEYFNECNEQNNSIYCPTHQELDLLDKKQVRKYLKKNKIDIVIHCANVNNFRYKLQEYDIVRNSMMMYLSLADSHNEYEKMIYFGSGAEYGRFRGTHLTKEERLGEIIPEDPYGFAKYMEAKLCDNYDNIYDLCLFGVYGKYEEWKRRFISNNIVRSMKGLPMTLSQNALFDYLYIEDLCKIVNWFVEHKPKHNHYNVCTSQPVDLLSLAKMINDVSGLNREIVIATEGWQAEYSGDNSRLLEEMGEFRFFDKKKSIEKLWNYYSSIINDLVF